MATTPTTATAPATAVTIVTQTRVLPEREHDFVVWQQHVNDVIASFPGLIDHQVIPPTPPAQVDWVILQKFETLAQAQAWLKSPQRLKLVEDVQQMLVGKDDVHLIAGDAARPPQAVSAVISMTIKPGQDEAYRVWNQRITATEAQYPGFLGHKLDPPVPGVQNDWVTVLTFDTEAHLDAWLSSAERRKLLQESEPFTADLHARKVRGGFEQWFRMAAGAALPPVWKQNMLTLLALYPVVFLFGHFVQTPLLQQQWGLPFFLALFIGNVASVLILTWLVPWVSQRFHWWLQPVGADAQRLTIIGAIAVFGLYLLLLLIFWRFL